MATCKYCAKSGVFFKVNRHGLCNRCHPIVAMNVSESKRIIDSSLELATDGKTVETRLSRLDLIEQHLRSMCDLERKGIPTFEPSATRMLAELPVIRVRAVLSKLEDQFELAMSKSELATTPRGKISPIAKVIEGIEQYKDHFGEADDAAAFETRVREAHHAIQCQTMREKAERAEFKGQKKQACNAYLDLLFFLRNDDINDFEQSAVIYEVEHKIKELGGEVPE
ncbi:MAG: hypothetical protein AAF297_01445 [Planctomycetota bacterium]